MNGPSEINSPRRLNRSLLHSNRMSRVRHFSGDTKMSNFYVSCHSTGRALIWYPSYSQKIQHHKLLRLLIWTFFKNTLSFELIILIETALWKRITFLNTAKLSLGFTAILENDRFREIQEVLVSTRRLFLKRKSPIHFLNAIKNGLNRDLNPGPLAPKARIIPLFKMSV